MANNILVYGTANPAPSAIPLALQRQQQEAAAQGTSSAPLTAENLANQSGGTGGTLSSMPYRPLNVSPLLHSSQTSLPMHEQVRDALSYLDEVKVQFSAQPGASACSLYGRELTSTAEVYNRFLDVRSSCLSQAATDALADHEGLQDADVSHS